MRGCLPLSSSQWCATSPRWAGRQGTQLGLVLACAAALHGLKSDRAQHQTTCHRCPAALLAPTQPSLCSPLCNCAASRGASAAAHRGQALAWRTHQLCGEPRWWVAADCFIITVEQLPSSRLLAEEPRLKLGILTARPQLLLSLPWDSSACCTALRPRPTRCARPPAVASYKPTRPRHCHLYPRHVCRSPAAGHLSALWLVRVVGRGGQHEHPGHSAGHPGGGC